MVTRLNEAHKALILVALYAMVTVVGVMYRKDMIETDVAMLFLLLNILSASVLKPRNAYLMMGLSIIDYHYFLLPDYQSFRFENAQYVITYAVLAFSGIFAVNITQAQRKQIEKISACSSNTRSTMNLLATFLHSVPVKTLLKPPSNF